MNDKRTDNLILSPAPHIHIGWSISGTMYTFVFALIPVIVFSIIGYGWHAVRVISLGISSAMVAEYIIQRIFGGPVTVSDGSAMLTGLLLALLFPPSVPWWLIVTGSVLAILVGKQIYGGLGRNPFNPVLIGWAAIRLSWNDYISFDTSMINYDLSFPVEYPLSVLKKLGASGLADLDYWGLFLGNQIGGIGTTAALLLLIGGIILLIRGVVSWRIPFFFLAGVTITALIFHLSDASKYADPFFHILTGNVMLAAFFIATDYSSSPVNKTAMALYGLGCGMFIVIFRVWSIYPDGVVFAILIMNILNPLLDKIRPKSPERERGLEEEKV